MTLNCIAEVTQNWFVNRVKTLNMVFFFLPGSQFRSLRSANGNLVIISLCCKSFASSVESTNSTLTVIEYRFVCLTYFSLLLHLLKNVIRYLALHWTYMTKRAHQRPKPSRADLILMSGWAPWMQHVSVNHIWVYWSITPVFNGSRMGPVDNDAISSNISE